MARNRESRLRAYRLGFAAEWLAAAILTLKGYRVLAMRYKTPVGEVDLIARKGPVIAFVEVKVRADLSSALYSIHRRNRERVMRAAACYLAGNRRTLGLQPRFDAFVFVPPFAWRHLGNAWQEE
ncbi:MAG: YraN family protein [Alphaproteobacteria bacterium]|nr:YraN family protein [Alphaproteobacteria bacterium]